MASGSMFAGRVLQARKLPYEPLRSEKKEKKKKKTKASPPGSIAGMTPLLKE